MNGTFTYISISALLCYLLLLITMAHAKKNRIISSFKMVLASLILWAGGSFFMRAQIGPSVKLWYDISLLGMWLVPCTLMYFLREFTGQKIRPSDVVMTSLIVAVNLYNIFTSRLLAAPAPVLQADGSVKFVYSFDVNAVFLYAVAFLAYAHVIINIIRYEKGDPELKRQFTPITIGMSALLVGNVIIMLPAFSGIPLDILSGVVNAICLFYMLYRRRLFKLTLLASRKSCYLLSSAATCIVFAYLVTPLQTFISEHFGLFAKYSVLIVAVLYAASTVIVTYAMKSAIDSVFVKEEQNQALMLEAFSLKVSRMLNVGDIQDALIDVVQTGVGIAWVRIMTRSADGKSYVLTRGSEPLDGRDVTLSNEDPIVRHLKKTDKCLMVQDLHTIEDFHALREEEKSLVVSFNIHCFVPLQADDELIGILILPAKEKNRRYTYTDESFLTSVKTVASIAIKNACLYEKADHDARTDDLTGLLNRKYFHEELRKRSDGCPDVSLALLLINVDDFKLYNQLYGNALGDVALRSVAATLSRVVGESGIVARYSGKEFVVLLSGNDVSRARDLAKQIRQQIAAISNYTDNGDKCKILTVSIGISSYPQTASTMKQLLQNAEQAVYQVKRNGKNGIMMFAAEDIHFRKADDSADYQRVYSAYAPTIYALTAAIDTKDHYTFNHSKNVAYYATHLAHACGLDGDSIEIINEAALLHDVGKIGIPEHVLNKKGRLTDEEFVEMKKHVENSVGIIRHLPSLDYVIPAVIGHHERYDGTGYPRRIAGEDIPLYARILCVADSFDAMTSRRVYKEPYSLEQTVMILQDQAGRQFDPKLVEIFIGELHEGRIELQYHETDDAAR